MDERSMFYNANGQLFRRAYRLRNRETESEKVLWTRLCKSQLDGFRFKRQHPIAYFVADFYCHKAKLVIELDGKYHDTEEQKLKDQHRTQIINEFGVRVIRFSDEEVFNNLESIVRRIREALR